MFQLLKLLQVYNSMVSRIIVLTINHDTIENNLLYAMRENYI